MVNQLEMTPVSGCKPQATSELLRSGHEIYPSGKKHQAPSTKHQAAEGRAQPQVELKMNR